MPVTARFRTSIVLLATVVGLSAAGLVPAQATPTTQEATGRDLQQLAAQVNDDNTPQYQRDEAARRLISRQNDEARRILLAALGNFSNRGGQLAAARAVGGAQYPDRAFIVPLFALLGPDKPLTDAAVIALSEYRSDPDVLTRLITVSLARQQRESVRLATLRALGRFVDKRAAGALVQDVLCREDESIAIRNAAADALMDLTGLRENENDVQRWQRWWETSSRMTDADFRNTLLADRATRLDRIQNRYDQLIDELQAILGEQYQAVPETLKADMLTRYLRSAQAEFRAVAARIIYDDSINNRTIPAVAREQLRSMIGDSSTAVRREVARALRAINDATAVEPLLTQLAQEPDVEVRASLASALAPIRDLRAVPQLVKLLGDPAPRVVQAAAEAMKELGPILREKDPALAATAANALRELLEKSASTLELRESILEALAPLRRTELLPLYLRLLNPAESIRIRRGVLRALGELHDPRSADGIVDSLDDAEPGVRLEAVIALGKSAATEHAEKLYRRLDPAIEADPSVQLQAWTVMETLLPGATKEQLAQWADRFKEEPGRRRVVLVALIQKLIEQKDDEQLAIVRQNLGETLMKLNQPVEAVACFRQALDYWKLRKEMLSESLTGQLLDALLKSRQFAEAVTFSASLIVTSPSHQQTVGPRIRAEAERLKEASDFQTALLLINEAAKMKPPLAALYREQLKILEAQIRQQLPDTKKPTTAPRSLGPGLSLFLSTMLPLVPAP